MTEIPLPVIPTIPVAAPAPVVSQPAVAQSVIETPVAQPVVPQSGEGTAAAGTPAPVHPAAVTPESQQAAPAAKPEPTNDQLIDAYVQLRDSADEIKARHQLELKDHNEMMAKITGKLEERMIRTDTKTFSTEHGAASRVITSKAVCNDFNAFYEWVTATKRMDVFPKKLNYTPFKEMLDNNQPLPPGIRIESSSRIQIRRKS